MGPVSLGSAAGSDRSGGRPARDSRAEAQGRGSGSEGSTLPGDSWKAGLSIDHLHRHPGHLERVARWIHAAFWTRSGQGVETVIGLLENARDPDRIPLSLLARVGDEPAGTVNLVACDSRERHDLTPWLAALYVSPEYRRRGIGAALVRALMAEAARLGSGEIYLETDIPDFYARLGAAKHQPLAEGGWIMRISVPLPTARSPVSATTSPPPPRPAPSRRRFPRGGP